MAPLDQQEVESLFPRIATGQPFPRLMSDEFFLRLQGDNALQDMNLEPEVREQVREENDEPDEVSRE